MNFELNFHIDSNYMDYSLYSISCMSKLNKYYYYERNTLKKIINIFKLHFIQISIIILYYM